MNYMATLHSLGFFQQEDFESSVAYDDCTNRIDIYALGRYFDGDERSELEFSFNVEDVSVEFKPLHGDNTTLMKCGRETFVLNGTMDCNSAFIDAVRSGAKKNKEVTVDILHGTATINRVTGVLTVQMSSFGVKRSWEFDISKWFVKFELMGRESGPRCGDVLMVLDARCSDPDVWYAIEIFHLKGDLEHNKEFIDAVTEAAKK
jgi:hypothetical protein